MEQAISDAGIRSRADGVQEVPASKRPDGSTRASIRIRPGFVPVEDRAKYKPPKTRAATSMAESSAVPRHPPKPTADTTLRKTPKVEQAKTHVTEVLASWSDNSWRGLQDAPSRYARSGDQPAESLPLRAADWKPEPSVRAHPRGKHVSSRANTKSVVAQDIKQDRRFVQGEDDAVVKLEEELHRVHLSQDDGER